MPEITLVSMTLDATKEASDGPLVALQYTLVTRLQQEQVDEDHPSRHYPAALDILYEQRMDILAELERNLANVGMCVFIQTPAAEDQSPDNPYPILDEVTVIAQVIENPLINRAEGGLGEPGGKVIWLVAQDLCRTIISGASVILERIWQSVDEEAGTVIWNASFKLSL